MSWLFSCFKHDPSKDNLKTALKISRYQDEDTAARLKLEEESAKEESLKEFEEEEAKRRLEKSKEKDKRKQVVDDDQVVEDKGQIKHSKDHVEENVNPSPSICKGCNFKIEDGRFVNAFDAVWHHQCLCCLHCHKQFALEEIPSLRGQYHKPCYKERRNCYVCMNKIPSTEEGIKYKEHPFWKEKYCPSHDDDGTAKCYSCERLESCATKYVMLEDGRWLCRECLECAVMDSDECCDLHFEIREYYEGLYMKIEKEFPLLLVEKEALNKAEKEEKIDHQYEVVTRGICLSEEQMVTSVKKRPEEVNNRLKGMATESQMVVRQCEVTAVLILYGLPKFLTGYILAHEMMHAYLRLNGYRNLNMVLEEGLCQVLGHMWLESQTYATSDVAVDAAPVADSSSASSSSHTPTLAATTSKKGYKFDFEKKFVEFCKYQIETDESPIYGVGFKKVNNMMVLNNHNLKDTLKQIVSASKSIPDDQDFESTK